MTVRIIHKSTIGEAWEESLRLFFKSGEANRSESRGDPCLEIEDLIFDIKNPHREPRISPLFPEDYIPFIESFTSRLLDPHGGHASIPNDPHTSQTSTLNTRMFRWPKRDGTLLNQLDAEIQHLHSNPGGRYSIIGFWDPEIDLFSDKPVGPIMAYFRVRSKKLNATVVTRSLDAMMGAVQLIVGFANLQEHLARLMSTGVGSLHLQVLSYQLLDIDVPRVLSMLESSAHTDEKRRHSR